MTKLETHAWWDFKHFYSSMFEIWKTYKRYGEKVLEVDMEEGDEKFKSLFTQSDNDDSLFAENVKKYWQQNYHFSVGNYKELSMIFSQHRQRENGELRLFPEKINYGNSEIKAEEQTYSIRKHFYDALIVAIQASNLRDLILVNYKEKSILTIHLSIDDKGIYGPIIVSECKKSEIIIV